MVPFRAFSLCALLIISISANQTLVTRLPRRRYSQPRFPLDIVVGLPEQEGNLLRNPFRLTIAKSMPVFDVAVEDIYHKQQLLPTDSLRITYEDTKLSDAIGPQKLVDRYCSRTVDAVMGLAYVFSLAPVARMSQYWEQGVPVFTTSAMVDELGDRQAFPLLTRLMGTYRTLAMMVLRLVEEFHWRQFHFFFNDQAVHGSSQGRSECFFSLNAIKNVFNKKPHIEWTVEMFSEQTTDRAHFRTLLQKASMLTNSRCHFGRSVFLQRKNEEKRCEISLMSKKAFCKSLEHNKKVKNCLHQKIFFPIKILLFEHFA